MLINGDSVVSGVGQADAKEFLFAGSLTAATTTDVGKVLSLQNTTGRDLYIIDGILDVTTKSTGAATLDIGVDDGGDTSSDKLFDGVDVGTAAGVFNTRKHAGTNGTQIVLWKSTEYIVATASASVAGLVGKYAFRAIPRL